MQTTTNKKLRIGFVGQGFVGKSYADNFEARGYKNIVRYSLEKPYIQNKDLIKTCDVVFVAVPTPTTPKGFDASMVKEALTLAGKGAIVVIKSTLLPGTTQKLQKDFKHLTVMFSPEYLSVATAAYDTAHPFASIVGMGGNTARHKAAAKLVMAILPKAPFSLICASQEAEISKYAHNISGYTQILTFNLMHDMAEAVGAKWSAIQSAVEADPFVCNRYASPIHKSGRGAGGACFIKDGAAFSRAYREVVGNKEAVLFLKAAEAFNHRLLTDTKKDLHLLKGVYGSKKK